MDTSTAPPLSGLLARVARGDNAAFAALYDASSGKLYGVIRRILVRDNLAEEALQETFVRIWRNAHRYDASVASAMTWMVAIARNQAIDAKRNIGERIAASAVALEDAGLAAISSSAEETADLRKLRECLGRLTEDARDMVLLAYYQGFSREELAQRFARAAGTVKTILRRALAALRECLDGVR